MSFKDLNEEELKDVAEFFVVEVVSSKDTPTKKEYLAALSAGDDPVTWEQYNEIYLPAKAAGQFENQEEEVPVGAESTDGDAEIIDDSDFVLIKYERNNPSFEILGYRFLKRHPFASVPEDVAEYLIRKEEGFRLALPSELKEYYG